MLEARVGDEQLGAVRLGHSHRFDKKLLAANTFPRSPSQHRRGGEGALPAPPHPPPCKPQRPRDERRGFAPCRAIDRSQALELRPEGHACESKGHLGDRIAFPPLPYEIANTSQEQERL